MENQKGKPMTMEEKQQLMRERLGRNIGKMYDKPVEIAANVATPKPADKSNKVVKGKEKMLETSEKVWRIELKITSVKLLYKLEIISKMHGKSKQQYFIGLLERDLAANADLFKNL